MNGHSPAPWTFRPNPCECPDCTAAFWIDSAPRSADERIGVPIGDVRDLGKASEANARLIAAAPELADSLAVLLVQFRHIPDASATEAIRKAREVLAKARGGA